MDHPADGMMTARLRPATFQTLQPVRVKDLDPLLRVVTGLKEN
jgi:hypothetical protein